MRAGDVRGGLQHFDLAFPRSPMKRRSRTLPVLLVVLLALVAAPVPSLAGSAPDLVFEWNAPPGCPDAAAVTADVRRTLGGDPSRRAIARAVVTEVADNRWSVRLVTDVGGSRGERSFEAESCASLASATALILAWTIDPVRASAGPQRPLPSGAEVQAAPVRAAAAVVVPSTASSATSRAWQPRALRVQGLVAISGAFDLGTLPQVGEGAELTAGALLGPLRLEAAGTAWRNQDATSGAEGTHLHMFSGLLRGCLRIEPRKAIELGPCLGGELTYVSSQGFNETQSFASTTTWSALRADALFVWAFAPPFAVRIAAGGAGALATPSFVVDEPGGKTVLLQQPARWVWRASFGLEAHFP
jgi:hypothetical protein